jgi:dTDP-4-dehydrorhamnose 3,5-epimerase
MKVKETAIVGLKYIELDPHLDERGAFVEAFTKAKWGELGIDFAPSQVNFSTSDKAGTIRGMHWQEVPMGQGKIVFALQGRVYDAVVDPRRTSYSFGKTVGYELFPWVNALYIPKGLAHGYQALEDRSGLIYLVDAPYSPSHECGLRYDDPVAGIPWPLPAVNVAPKDLRWPTLKEIDRA